MKRLFAWLKKYFIPHEGNNHQPHFLRHETMLAFFLLIIIIEIGFLVQVFIVFDKTKFLASVLPGVLATLTNEERAQNAVPPLKENPLLSQAAQLKAEDMAKNGYFAHTSPTGITPWYWFNQVGYKDQYAGENLAVNFFESADVGNAWMNSPTHRANIVKPVYTEIGIGVANGIYEGRSTVFVAQLFGTPLTPSVTEQTPITETKPIQPKTITKSTNPPQAPVQPTTPKLVETTPQNIPTQNITPTATRVLGEENVSSGGIIATLKAEMSALKSFAQRAVTSPKQYITYIFSSFVFALLVILILAIFIRSEIQHPKIIARGVGLMAVVVFLLFLNLQIAHTNTKVPNDGLSATVLAY